MVIFRALFRGQHEMTLIGSEQTTSSLVVLIWSGRGESNPHGQLGKLEFYH